MIDLNTDIQYLKGVGPKRASLLKKLNINKIGDILFHYPRRYIDRTKIKDIRSLCIGETATVMGMVCGLEIKSTSKGKVFVLSLSDGSGFLSCTWFDPRYKGNFKMGDTVVVNGKVGFFRGKQMIHPEYETVSGEETELLQSGRIVPVYSLTEKLTQRELRKAAKFTLDNCLKFVNDHLPLYILQKRGLAPLKEAISNIHFPESKESIELAHRRLVYDEFFNLQLLLAKRRELLKKDEGISFNVDGELHKKFLQILDFEFTDAQKRVTDEIRRDMALSKPMNRLLQGDVGSGKTVVAAYASLIAVGNGYQVAVMAPTEILAEQHYSVLKTILGNVDVKISLLIGSLKSKEKKSIYEIVQNGEVNLVVGTHALIEEDVKFKNLGFVVVDEQHRFGVMQRVRLKRKGHSPDFLVMTATPIPRTLALTVYGDLDVSVLDELPPGRGKTVTKLTQESKRKKVYEFIREKIEEGNQAFIVYPLVEESEKIDLKAAKDMHEMLKNSVFPEFKVGLIHGRMKGEDKDEIMHKFRDREYNILVSTTVIEVGVDIPNATIMLIEHAERYGLAQLHQLRGRIGRGAKRSYCILIASGRITDDAKERLKTIEATTDGFKISEKDLRLRGPGEFFGERQHGLPELRLADIFADQRILSAAREDAFELVREDPKFLCPEHKSLKENFYKREKKRIELFGAG